MLIDWFTVGAQTLNFLVLVWLLKRFLYKPILDAIDAREQRIATELADADAKRDEARQERDTYQKKIETFDQQRAKLLQQASEEADTERQRLLEIARQEVDTLRAKRRDGMQREQDALQIEIGRRTTQEVFAITRKVLADLADASLEQRIGDMFAQRLQAMPAEAQARLLDALQTSPEAALVRSAFELPAAQQTAIQQAFKQTFSSDVELRFEIAPALIGGVECSVNGQKIAWSIADYLGALESSIEDLLKAPSGADPVTSGDQVK